jgi:8-oxo-dGTP pyrophosphatase MutT (NUDIX family)
MMREISAGGVVVRKQDSVWWMAAIELPLAANPASDPRKRAVRSKTKAVLCLPKGLIDPGEKALEAALREVREETGIIAAPIAKLGDIKYVYVRTWGDGQRVFKLVSFYLLRYESGDIDDIAEEMRVEVGRRALDYIEAHAEM